MSNYPITESNGAVNIIAAGTIIEGEVKSNGDIQVNGTVKGSVITKGKVIIGETGEIDGSASCANAEVSGSFKGDINVGELLYLKSNSKLNGNITANKLAIDSGATFTGGCKMGEIKNTIVNKPYTPVAETPKDSDKKV